MEQHCRMEMRGIPAGPIRPDYCPVKAKPGMGIILLIDQYSANCLSSYFGYIFFWYFKCPLESNNITYAPFPLWLILVEISVFIVFVSIIVYI